MRNALLSLVLGMSSSFSVPFKNHINTENPRIRRPKPLNLHPNMFLIRNEPIPYYPLRQALLIRTERSKLGEWHPLRKLKD